MDIGNLAFHLDNKIRLNETRLSAAESSNSKMLLYIASSRRCSVLGANNGSNFDQMSSACLQKRVYRRVLQSDDFQLLVRLNEPCDCGSGNIRGNCCHTSAENGILYHHLHEVGEPGPHK
jgi:hypothetical protein